MVDGGDSEVNILLKGNVNSNLKKTYTSAYSYLKLTTCMRLKHTHTYTFVFILSTINTILHSLGKDLFYKQKICTHKKRYLMNI